MYLYKLEELKTIVFGKSEEAREIVDENDEYYIKAKEFQLIKKREF